ncbi:MAG: DHH family phosphoesterase [Candidatus Diapherotrites archaeon]|nr:DHH family phosphoesterase [Candidatus Diapherotrites archaeon]
MVVGFKKGAGEEAEKKAVAFLKNACEKDRILVLGHGDGDGVCSIAILCEFLKRKKVPWKRRVLFDAERAGPAQETMSVFEEFRPTKIIMADFPVQGKLTDFVKQFRGIKEVLVIDHHNRIPIQSDYITLFDPRTFTEDDSQVFACAYLAYYLCSLAGDVSGLSWVAAIGSRADWMFDKNSALKEALGKEFGFMRTDGLNPLADDLVGIVDFNHFLKSKEYEDEVFRLIDESVAQKNPLLFLSEKHRFENLFEMFQNKKMVLYDSVSSEVAGAKKLSAKIVVLNMKQSEGSRTIASVVAAKYLDYLVVVCSQSDKYPEKINMSVRNSSGEFDCGKVVHSAMHGLDGFGGGHPYAAGGTIVKTDIDRFFKNLDSCLK